MSALPKNQIQFLNPILRVENLTNPVNFSWNEDLLKIYIHPDDVEIILSIPVSRSSKPDTYG